MAILGAVGGGAFVLVSLWMGLRLVVMARATRELPELMIGLGLLLMGGLGYPLVATARLGVALADPARLGLGLAGFLLMWAGQVSVCVFNWRVFRPTDGWARAFTIGFGLFLGACLGAQLVSPGLRAAALENHGIPLRIFLGLLGVALGWGALESFHHHALLRRRQALGLVDPVVTDRIQLWAFAMSTSLVLNITTSLAAMFGVDFPMTSAGAFVTGALGLATAGALWLAFRAPASYHERVRARAAALQGAGAGEG